MNFFRNKAVLVNTEHAVGKVEVSDEFPSVVQANHAGSKIAHTPPNVALERRDNPDTDGTEYDYLVPANEEKTVYHLNTVSTILSSEL